MIHTFTHLNSYVPSYVPEIISWLIPFWDKYTCWHYVEKYSCLCFSGGCIWDGEDVLRREQSISSYHQEPADHPGSRCIPDSPCPADQGGWPTDWAGDYSQKVIQTQPRLSTHKLRFSSVTALHRQVPVTALPTIIINAVDKNNRNSSLYNAVFIQHHKLEPPNY